MIIEDGITLEQLNCPRMKNRQPVAWSSCWYMNDWRVEADDRLSLVWTDFEPMTDETKRGIYLAWQATPKELNERWKSTHPTWKTSRWWPWNWFR